MMSATLVKTKTKSDAEKKRLRAIAPHITKAN
jgi:hypothetical protein